MSNTAPSLTISAILEIAIVLVAIYAGLSWVISAVHERIADALKLRGQKLYQGVLNLVSGHDDLAREIFKHPLIAASSDDRTSSGNLLTKIGSIFSLVHPLDSGDIPKDPTGEAVRNYRPSYIDARTFSMAFWSKLGEMAPSPPKPGDAPPPAAGDAPAPGVADSLAAKLALPTKLITDIQSSLGAIKTSNPDLYKSCTALLTAADGDYERLLRVTDGWFSAQMDRVSGWYTRQTQWVLAFLALVLVTFSGVDTIEIATKLYAEPQLRSAVADNFSKAITDGTCPPAVKKDGTVVASPSPSSSAAPIPAATATAEDATSKAQKKQKALLCAEDQQAIALADWINPSIDVRETWGKHGAGMLITLGALALGGPFWFDLLCSLVKMRSSGRKPQRKDQPPK